MDKPWMHLFYKVCRT